MNLHHIKALRLKYGGKAISRSPSSRDWLKPRRFQQGDRVEYTQQTIGDEDAVEEIEGNIGTRYSDEPNRRLGRHRAYSVIRDNDTGFGTYDELELRKVREGEKAQPPFKPGDRAMLALDEPYLFVEGGSPIATVPVTIMKEPSNDYGYYSITVHHPNGDYSSHAREDYLHGENEPPQQDTKAWQPGQRVRHVDGSWGEGTIAGEAEHMDVVGGDEQSVRLQQGKLGRVYPIQFDDQTEGNIVRMAHWALEPIDPAEPELEDTKAYQPGDVVYLPDVGPVRILGPRNEHGEPPLMPDKRTGKPSQILRVADEHGRVQEAFDEELQTPPP